MRLAAAVLVVLMTVTVFFAARTIVSAFGVGFETPAAVVVSLLFALAVWRKAFGFANALSSDNE